MMDHVMRSLPPSPVIMLFEPNFKKAVSEIDRPWLVSFCYKNDGELFLLHLIDHPSCLTVYSTVYKFLHPRNIINLKTLLSKGVQVNSFSQASAPKLLISLQKSNVTFTTPTKEC